MMAAEPVVKNANYKKRRGHNTAVPINYISKLLHVLAPQAASTVRASVRFAAALCEISGSFLIFTSARGVAGSRPISVAEALGLVAAAPREAARLRTRPVGR